MLNNKCYSTAIRYCDQDYKRQSVVDTIQFTDIYSKLSFKIKHCSYKLN